MIVPQCCRLQINANIYFRIKGAAGLGEFVMRLGYGNSCETKDQAIESSEITVSRSRVFTTPTPTVQEQFQLTEVSCWMKTHGYLTLASLESSPLRSKLWMPRSENS